MSDVIAYVVMLIGSGILVAALVLVIALILSIFR